MLMITFFVFSILLCISIISEKKIYNPSFLFCIFWFVLLFLANLHLFDLYEFSDKIVILILIGVTFFCLGSLTYRKRLKFKKTASIVGDSSGVHKKLLYILLGLSVVLLLYRLSFQMPYIMSGYSISDIRYLNLVKYSSIQFIFFNYFSLPFLDACTTVMFVDCIYNDKKMKYYLLPASTLCLSFLSNGARLSIFQMIVIIFFALLILKKINIFKIKMVLKYVLIFAILLCFISFINTDRGGVSFFNSIYDYFSGSVVFGDRIMNYKDLGPHLYGVNSFIGVLKPIFSFLGMIGIPEPTIISDAEFLSDMLNSTIYAISPITERYNYFATCFVYFFKDGGYIGVSLISYLYGIICKHFYLRLEDNMNIKTVSMYLFILAGIFTSMMHFCFSYFIYVMALVYIWLLTTKFKFRGRGGCN